MDKTTITGLVATTPRFVTKDNGKQVLHFRVATQLRRWDETANSFVHGSTNWYTVMCFDQLAVNGFESIHKGDKVIVYGNLWIRDWDNGENYGTTVEIEAITIGHDLRFGHAEFTRVQLTAKDED